MENIIENAEKLKHPQSPLGEEWCDICESPDGGCPFNNGIDVVITLITEK
jgi:hypothetical protein